MKKTILMMSCFALISCTDKATENIPVAGTTAATTDNGAVIPLVDEIDLSLLQYNDQILFTDEKCEGTIPLISLKKYKEVKLTYKEDGLFKYFVKSGSISTHEDNIRDYEFNLTYLNQSFNIGTTSSILPPNAYADLMLLGGLKFKSLDSEKMVLKATVFGYQCEYSFDVPQVHDTDRDGIDDDKDCAPSDATRAHPQYLFVDNDGDGYGQDKAELVCSIEAEVPGYAGNNEDCDDTNVENFQEYLLAPDFDGDGYTTAAAELFCSAPFKTPAGYRYFNEDRALDCNDNDPTNKPYGIEILDNKDNNCYPGDNR